MPLRERLKNFKGRLVKARQALGGEDSLTQSTSSLPDVQNVPQTINPAPEPSTTPAAKIVGPGQTWACRTAFLQVLDKCSGAFGPLKAVMGDLAQCIDMHENAAMAQKDYEALRLQLEALFNDLSSHFSSNLPPTATTSMDNLCRAIENELDSISSLEGRQARRRHQEAAKDLDDLVECYRRIQGHLQRLTLNADLNIWKIVDEQATETRLKSLTPSMSACYNSAESALVRRRECTPKTREQVLAELGGWRHDRNQSNMYWLNGMAGTGKTTITNSLCAMLDRAHELGASFFCTRQLPECRNVKLIIPTIAYQLARFSHPFRCALSRVLDRDPDVHTRVLSNQLDSLIIGPLREVAHTLPTDLVVVIDALDECDDSNGVDQILGMLAKHAPELPIKVFVSSRPEPQIREKIGSTRAQLILHELDKSVVKEDIETYLRTELACMSVSESQLATLVERAGVLFIYAATVVRYIGEDNFSLDPKRRLENVLGVSEAHTSNKNQEIDELYTFILSSALDSPKLEETDKHQIQLVLHTVICARRALTVDAIARLLQLNDTDQVHFALRRLWSVLHISGANRLVTTLHASFPDYMLNSDRSKKYCCNAKAHHGRLAELCLERIKRNERQFNICELESSYLFDEEVPRLAKRIRKAIPQDLMYACQYWAVHLELGGQSSERMQLLKEFLSTRLLLWMEVLNLKKRIDIGAVLLEKAKGWCTEGDGPQQLIDLVHDAWRFITMYAANAVSLSTPHLYVSMLAFWPKSRLLADCYAERARGLVEVGGTGVARRQLALLSAFTVDGAVSALALSPDGLCFASGSGDGTVRVWDAQNGQVILGPLKGHTREVCSVAFSPSGIHIISGSWDSTICMWDGQNGQMVLGPLEGHTNIVHSVAFSPDGMHLVSGSSDFTIRIWDVQNGRTILVPLEGHTGSVNSVAFSPDGTRIVSGSSDKTIRMWDAQNGHPVRGPLEGHVQGVCSVAFSPDGTHIVSGSEDRTVCVWDAHDGQMLLGPLEGHTGPVTSVAFSSNCMYIASGSFDCTIRVWDTQSGQMVQGPLEGHTGTVFSVAFMPNGMRIISASYDYTIRTWDAQNGRTVPGPLEGHTEQVSSVAFSPDGTHIVSGSLDSTMCIWDAQTGQMISGPGLFDLNEGIGTVSSVVFSHDGTRIISGSYALEIRMWLPYIEQMEQEPLEEHPDTVSSASSPPADTAGSASSPPADTAGSASSPPEDPRVIPRRYGFMICSWDMKNEQGWKGILGGHTGMVDSIAFSPDGMRIVSSFDDHTICVWEAENGQIILGPLEGHVDTITSVAFSPDSRRIASGSSDGRIFLWDAQTGQVILGPLEGHTNRVSSVALSPDDMHIISGSWDFTIRVWDTQNGQMVQGPLKGHTRIITSVAVSADSRRIISGSCDKTICIWDLQDGHMLLGPLVGHTHWVNSVAFSPDGVHVASGSADHVVRVWDVQSLPLNTNSAPCPSNSPSPSFLGDRPTLPTQSVLETPSTDLASTWVIDEDGWVIDEHQRLCLWVPPDLRTCLLVPGNTLLMSRQGSIRLNFDDANIGESWVQCYSPV